MLDITADMVRELRERTGIGMMDCKKTLRYFEGDMVKAEAYLNVKQHFNGEPKPDKMKCFTKEKDMVDFVNNNKVIVKHLKIKRSGVGTFYSCIVYQELI